MTDLVKFWHFLRHPVTIAFLAWWVATTLVGSWRRGAYLLVTLALAWLIRQFVLWRKARLAMYREADLRPARLPRLVGRFLLERMQAQILQRQWAKACDSLKLQTPVLKRSPRLKQIRGNLSNDFTALIYPGGVGLVDETFRASAAKLPGLIRWGCRQVNVTLLDPGNCRVDFSFATEFEKILPLSKLKMGPAGTLVYGIRRDGSPAYIWSHMSVMIGGLTRKGKSVICKTLIASAHKQKLWLDLCIADTKKGIELSAFGKQVGKRHGTVMVRDYVTTPGGDPKSDPNGAVEMVQRMADEMNRRAEWMIANDVVQLTPSEQWPQIVGIFDETLPLHDMLKAGTKGAAGEIGFSGAAMCVSLWINTQMGHASVIGQLRELIPQRICFSTPTWQATETILGSGAWTEGRAACHKLGNRPGVGWSGTDEDAEPAEFRANNVGRDEYLKLAAGRLPAEWSKPDAAAGAPVQEDFVLYRVFDDDPEFVAAAGTEFAYAGISNDYDRREREHSAGKQSADWKFCPQHGRRENYWLHHAPRPGQRGDELVIVDGTKRIEITPLGFVTRKEALREEKLAIKTERPYFNAVHNGDRESVRTRLRVRFGPKAPRLRPVQPLSAPHASVTARDALRPQRPGLRTRAGS